MKAFIGGFALSCMFLLIVTGCATELKPAPSAQTVSGMPNAAKARAQGISIIAQAADWPGRAEIQKKVTPLRIKIENNSGGPLRISYDEFALIAPNGERFSALPLYQIEGKVPERVSGPYLGPPEFAYQGFAVAPYYGPRYPDMTPYAGDFYVTPFYNQFYYHYWTNVSLPTADMRLKAIPEGVLSSGGSLEGWLFFEKVNDKDKQVMFRADLSDATTGKQYAEIRIPFSVK